MHRYGKKAGDQFVHVRYLDPQRHVYLIIMMTLNAKANRTSMSQWLYNTLYPIGGENLALSIIFLRYLDLCNVNPG